MKEFLSYRAEIWFKLADGRFSFLHLRRLSHACRTRARMPARARVEEPTSPTFAGANFTRRVVDPMQIVNLKKACVQTGCTPKRSDAVFPFVGGDH